MEHTNDIIREILWNEYADYNYNTWHYDSEYRMLEKLYDIMDAKHIKYLKLAITASDSPINPFNNPCK